MKKILKYGLVFGLAGAIALMGNQNSVVAAENDLDVEGVVVSIEDQATSGTCGDTSWQVVPDSKGGYVLSITGNGKMGNCYNSILGDGTTKNGKPWADYEKTISAINIGDGVTYIGAYAFSRCDNLTSVYIGSSVTSIGGYAFQNCSKLQAVTIPNSVTKIEGNALYGCSALKTVNMGTGVTTLAEAVFKDCTSLEAIILPASCTSIGESAFSHCEKLQSVTIPDGVTEIKPYTFAECRMLSTVQLGSKVTSIGEFAFYNCALKSIEVPKTVTQIGEWGLGYWMGEPISDFTIAGYKGTAAEYYAKQNNLRFVDASTLKIREFATRMYTTALKRAGDEAGIEHWTSELVAKRQTGATLVANFFMSTEFLGQDISNDDFIKRCYATIFDREPDQAGYDHWMLLLTNGVTRKYVLSGFCKAPEFSNLCQSFSIVAGAIELTENRDMNENVTMYVFRCYDRTLGREPDVAGMNHWTGQILGKTANPTAVAKSIVFSPEFAAKNYSDEEYVKILYRMFFDREYDQSGLNHWTSQLKSGVGREAVLDSFGATPEFAKVLASFGF